MATLLEIVTQAVNLGLTEFEVTDSTGTYAVHINEPVSQPDGEQLLTGRLSIPNQIEIPKVVE